MWMREREFPVEGVRPLTETQVHYMRELFERIRSLGAQPVLLLGPGFRADPHLAAVWNGREEHFPDIPVLNYLKGFSALDVYDLNYWFDSYHMNAEGAHRLSEQLAKDLAPLIRAWRGAAAGTRAKYPTTD